MARGLLCVGRLASGATGLGRLSPQMVQQISSRANEDVSRTLQLRRPSCATSA